MSITFSIYNSLSNIYCSSFDLKVLRDAISFYDMNIYFRSKSWHRARKYLISKSGEFPTGLMPRICQHLNESNLTYKIEDFRVKPNKYLSLSTKIKEPKLYIDQENAINAFLKSKGGRGIVVLPTGVGKTRCMKDTIEQLGVNTLIILPGLNLSLQTYKYFSACFGSKQVGYLNKKGNNKPITITNLDALENYPKENLSFFDCVFWDEYHHEACVTARSINETKFNDIYYKFATTATNFRNNKNEQILLETVLSRELYNLPITEAVNKKYIVPIQPLFFETDDHTQLDSPIMQAKYENDKEGLHYATVYKKHIVEHDERNDKFIKSAKIMHSKKIPTLILVKEIAHGELFKDALPNSHFVNGTLDKKENYAAIEEFNKGKIPILIGTSVIGEGIDTKLAGAILMADGEKSKIKVMQKVGRVVRTSPGKQVGFVVDSFDKGHKHTLKHSRSRKRLYKKEYGCEIKNLSL